MMYGRKKHEMCGRKRDEMSEMESECLKGVLKLLFQSSLQSQNIFFYLLSTMGIENMTCLNQITLLSACM